MSKILYIIRGLPGSGKTTLARVLAPYYNVSADDFMVDEEGNFCFDPERLGEVHKRCEIQVIEWMTQGHSVIAVHNTFGHLDHAKPYIDMASRYGYTPVLLEAQGNFTSEHGVPAQTIKRMVATWDDTKTLYYERKLGSFKG